MSANIYANSLFSDVPLGLRLQQTITTTGTTSVTIPSNVKRVFAVCIGGGGSGGVTHRASQATITNASGNGTVVTYTANNTFVVGDNVSVAGITPSTLNQTGAARITSASSTQFTIAGTQTGIYISGGTASCGGAAGGGGAGGISMGWTFAANTVTVGAGGAAIVTPAEPVTGNAGGFSRYGLVIAGGGGGGIGVVQAGAFSGVYATGPGACNGGNSSIANNTLGSVIPPTSYTGMQSASVAGMYNPSSTQPGVSTPGVGGTFSYVGGAATATSAATGLICGGGGAASTSGVATGGAGGTGDLFSGGTGSTGTGFTFGAGGGGAGYLGSGTNASGNTAGNGGNGGGGGGGANNLGSAGSGGNGVVYLYY
jgi:hypothetical protein